MTRILLPALLLSAQLAAADTDFSIDGRTYRLVTTARTWDAAEADAASKGGHLVHIDSQAENDRLMTAIQGLGVTTTAGDGGGAVYVWIGGKETTEGTYAWADALTGTFWTGGKTGSVTAGNFANWGRNTITGAGPEPDNFNSTQNRAAMALQAWPAAGTSKIGQPGQWNDIAGTNSLAYIIEFDGMWATFRMTHGGAAAGSFTAKLFPDKVPYTVANFVGLAEGTQPFIDEKKGTVATRPFYNGLLCHRIISGFMIQGGCPRGTGTSGPGYKFADEFDTTLRHTVGGKLSMANSGQDTNGSQFFVTVAATTHLDNVHSIFGEVVDGYSTTVVPLSNVTTGASDRPVQNVVIEEVTIHRAGTLARTLTRQLPQLSLIPLTPSFTGGSCLMDFPRTPLTGYDLLRTSDFSTWTLQELGSFGENVDTTPLNGTSFANNAPRQYFRLAQVSHPAPPVSLQGKKIVMESAISRTTLNLSGATTGTYLVEIFNPVITNSGTISSYTWERDDLGGELTANIPAGSFSIGTNPIACLFGRLRPQTNLSRGFLLLSDKNNGYTAPGTSKLTITNLP